MFFHQSCQSYKSILIIDNDPNNQCSLSKILQSQGITVKKTVSGTTSIEVAKQELPDLILLDINIPEINGYEVYQQLKTQIETANIPILFISTPEQTLAKIMSFNIGRVDYTEKNFQESEVLAPRKNKSLFWQQHEGIMNQNQGLWQEIWESQKAKQTIQVTTLVDELTGIANRRKFDEYFNLEWQRLSRENLSLSLLLCDVDCFKSYNDTYGYLSGDSCLQQIAKTIKLSVKRSTDLLARYQEEKFAIILPNTEFEGAVYLAELIRKEVYNLKIPHSESKVDNFITLSIGLATIFPQTKILPNTLIEMVDKALAEAKIHGRNLIVARKII
ncbi:diguanylate cyclase [Anabaena cylindrica UHCC 0172]|uniref:diguanylate cyclase domain-containing protein n=1 Tax=Anabaena cylindrica TaxID=1165 RepID=UPI002B21E3AF|nr:diguanylate cyclase [Anabaena cylindrica]MEA5553827.1 diguanylate cyclase [Anabaena cylindrica UHCC 0172]